MVKMGGGVAILHYVAVDVNYSRSCGGNSYGGCSGSRNFAYRRIGHP